MHQLLLLSLTKKAKVVFVLVSRLSSVMLYCGTIAVGGSGSELLQLPQEISRRTILSVTAAALSVAELLVQLPQLTYFTTVTVTDTIVKFIKIQSLITITAIVPPLCACVSCRTCLLLSSVGRACSQVL